MESSPLSIEPFQISSITLASGARLGLCRLPGRAGDLAADVAQIAGWAPAIVVSMTGTAEMQDKGAAGLGSALIATGIAHAHFPVHDFGVPDEGDAGWPALSARLHAVLDQGGSVLLHCLGGKGRSGMIALKLMVERGVPADAALEAIRRQRPGAVETAEQEAWANGVAAIGALNDSRCT
ncbi:MAG: hypothetical protein FD175_798 [Beijerinckiaceae bacterium]|nr:MAG: hypothetical protein FD175_798 [Beijerinckiaceae bacterium]